MFEEVLVLDVQVLHLIRILLQTINMWPLRLVSVGMPCAILSLSRVYHYRLISDNTLYTGIMMKFRTTILITRYFLTSKGKISAHHSELVVGGVAGSTGGGHAIFIFNLI